MKSKSLYDNFINIPQNQVIANMLKPLVNALPYMIYIGIVFWLQDLKYIFSIIHRY